MREKKEMEETVCLLAHSHAHTKHVYFHKPVAQRGVYTYIHMHV